MNHWRVSSHMYAVLLCSSLCAQQPTGPKVEGKQAVEQLQAPQVFTTPSSIETPSVEQRGGDVAQPKAAQKTKAPAATTASPPAVKEEGKPADPMSSSNFSGLKFRSIGPALVAGRVIAIALNPKDRAQYYVGVASGGVWKTNNDGATWTPVFDNEGSYSIGDVKLDPKDPSVVWVGTGENNSQRSVGYGDGVYKSEDGGKSWKNVGLKHSEHIGRIAIDPKDSNIVYVAAEGPLWSPGGDRGMFKTSDGGKTWKNVLNISENTGFADVVIDPEDPKILYAAAYQRRRHIWTMIDGGPESGLYKSSDAGATWTRLKWGLPSEDMGRIGVAVSTANPNIIYATIEAANAKGGVFRSTDKGATWERRNPFNDTAFYYGQVIADPKSVDRIYVMGVRIRVSDDGGKTLRLLEERNKHGDNHVLWIDPSDTNYYLCGDDGGVYESFDRGVNWVFKANLPLGQFYDVTVDNSKPFYYVYGGTQDNNNVGGPSRTSSISGITNADWFITQGGDGFRSQVDPEDANTVYAEYQYGALTRYDRATGTRTGIQPTEAKGEEPNRWNWDSPILISPHSHTRLYFAANRLYRSEDRGDTWKAISGDLTRHLDRDKLPVMGKIWGPDAVAKNNSTDFYGNISALAESPKQAGVLFVGSDDGLIQITNNGGQSWRREEHFPGVPDMTYVSRLVASQHDAKVVYAAFDNHKNGDFKPYLLKSTNSGQSWTSMVNNLPGNGPVLAIAEDHIRPELLFVGTEFGVFFSNDGGGKWIQLKGNLPIIAVRDLVIQKREDDLVVGTFGRGIYILDDYAPLRNVDMNLFAKAAHLFAPRETLLYVESRRLGSRKGAQGESYFTADNPAFGATFTYYLKDKLKTKREQRVDAEKTAEKANATKRIVGPYASLPYPTKDEIRAEAEEEAPSVFLTIRDNAGNAIRRVSATNTFGLNRATWDLRYPTTVLRDSGTFEGDEDEENAFMPSLSGMLVLPGKYSATLSQTVNGGTTQIAGPVEFHVASLGMEQMTPSDRQALLQFQQKVASLNRAVAGAMATGNEVTQRLRSLKRAIREAPADPRELTGRANELENHLRDLMRQLRGDIVLRGRQESTPMSIHDHVNKIMDEERVTTARPTQSHIDSYNLASQEFSDVIAKMHQLIDVDVKKLEDDAQAAGAAWTSGYLPTWSPK